jgi:hypothetical protein
LLKSHAKVNCGKKIEPPIVDNEVLNSDQNGTTKKIARYASAGKIIK